MLNGIKAWVCICNLSLFLFKALASSRLNLTQLKRENSAAVKKKMEMTWICPVVNFMKNNKEVRKKKINEAKVK